MPDALQSVLTQTGVAISRFRDIKTPDQAVVFFRQLGYEIPTAAFGPSLTSFANQTNELLVAVRLLSTATGEGGVAAALVNLLTKVVQTVQSITQLHSDIMAGGGGALPNINDLPNRLLDFFILDFLNHQNPATHSTLHLIGLIEHDSLPAPNQAMYQINWDRFGLLLNKPAQIINDVYNWDTDPDIDLILSRLEAIMRSTSLPGGMYLQPESTRLLLDNNTTGLKELRFTLFQNGISPETYSQFGITFSPVEAGNGQSKGIAVLPYLMGAAAFDFDVCDRGELIFEANGELNGIGLVVRPPLSAEGLLNMNSNFRGTLQIREIPAKSNEIILIGTAGGSRLSVQGLGMRSFIQSTNNKPDFGIEGELQALRLVIKGGEGDGFLQKIFSGLNVQAEAALAFGFSLLSGFYFRGGAKLAMEFPTHIELGPLEIKGLRFELGPSNDHLALETGIVVNLSLGPLKAVVENIGIKSKLSFKNGNLGPADLSFGFKPPNGIGLSIDAGMVKGGGYLYFDFDKEEYAGVLELSLVKIVTVKAIGLITTKMPDGSKGFSLLLIITAEFGTGIQLGFGFTLLGVGGLLGLNRTMLLEPLASGIRTGAINSIMFPPDPVANAPRIISDLRTYFPPYEGKFLIGPMIKLGWGTPTLISIAFGLIIEIPGNIAIVGVLRINLPEENVPIVTINVAFVGAIEFDKSRIWFFAAMFDSRILFMTMEGDMGLLMDFGSNPNFVLSVGGFHPQFSPPPLPFPNPRRIHIDILRTPVARITAENYFAVTSNTVQFGCRADFFYGVSAFNLHGSLSFDALFQFSPFRFVIDISFSLGMDVFGVGVFSVRLKLQLSGPAPWNARGTATLSIDLWLFSIEISVDFNITWGEADNPKIPAVDAIPILVAEYNKSDNWKAEIPANLQLLVSLRKLDTTVEKLVLHPVGTLKVSQKTVPLGIHVDKIGNAPVADAHLFTVEVATAELAKRPDAPKERFAIAQFQEMSDAEKLSRQAFQEIDAGVELAFNGKQLGSSKVTKRIVRYEVKINDIDGKHGAFRWFSHIGTLFFHWLGGAAISKSDLSYAKKKSMVPTLKEERVKVRQPGFVVAGVNNNKALSGSAVFASEAHAHDYLKETISKNPGMMEEIHVIPKFEATEV